LPPGDGAALEVGAGGAALGPQAPQMRIIVMSKNVIKVILNVELLREFTFSPLNFS